MGSVLCQLHVSKIYLNAIHEREFKIWQTDLSKNVHFYHFLMECRTTITTPSVKHTLSEWKSLYRTRQHYCWMIKPGYSYIMYRRYLCRPCQNCQNMLTDRKLTSFFWFKNGRSAIVIKQRKRVCDFQNVQIWNKFDNWFCLRNKGRQICPGSYSPDNREVPTRSKLKRLSKLSAQNVV